MASVPCNLFTGQRCVWNNETVDCLCFLYEENEIVTIYNVFDPPTKPEEYLDSSDVMFISPYSLISSVNCYRGPLPICTFTLGAAPIGAAPLGVAPFSALPCDAPAPVFLGDAPVCLDDSNIVDDGMNITDESAPFCFELEEENSLMVNGDLLNDGPPILLNDDEALLPFDELLKQFENEALLDCDISSTVVKKKAKKVKSVQKTFTVSKVSDRLICADKKPTAAQSHKATYDIIAKANA